MRPHEDGGPALRAEAVTRNGLCAQGTATALSTVLQAAHQPVWQVWNFAAFAQTPLEQGALTFIPSANSKFEAQETIKVPGFLRKSSPCPLSAVIRHP